MYRPIHASLSFSLFAVLAIGCTNDAPDADPTPSEESTGDASTGDASTGDAPASTDGADSSGGGLDLDALYECEETELQVIQPLMGPGFDPETGELLEPLQDTYVLHTTQILVKPDQVEAFLALNFPIFEQLGQTEGLVGFALAQEPNCGFSRTMGVWRDEQSMVAFVASGAHVQAMAKSTEVSLTGRTTSWTVTAAEMPLTWELAIAAIAQVEPSPIYP